MLKGHGLALALALTLVVFLALGCGEPRDVPVEAKGIITMAPHFTEAVFALGQGHRMIGISAFCDYPPEAMSLPKLGGYLNPDYERLSLLRPELVIVAGRHEELSAFAAMRGLPLLNVHMDSFETIDSGIAAIGEALGCVDAADGLRRRIREELDVVRKAVSGEPRPKVLIINSRINHDLNTLLTTRGGSFVSELVEVAGGDNIFGDAGQTYFEASKESVVLLAPEVILEFHAGENLSDEEQAKFVADWNAMATLPAVRTGRVYLFLESYGLRPGPRVGLTARRIAALLYPDKDFDLP